MRWSRVVRDPAVLVVLAYMAVLGIVLLAWPSPELAWGSEVYLELPVAVFVVIVIARRTARLRLHREGNTFWALVLGALVALVGASIVFAIDGGPSMPSKLFGDGLYALFYLGLLLAPEERPHGRPGWTETSVSHRYWRLGTAVFVFSLIGYFAVVPAIVSPGTDELCIPAFASFVALDIIIAVRFIGLGRRVTDPAWVRPYRGIGTAAACWCVLDALDGLWYATGIGFPGGTLLDLAYYVPHLALLMSVPTTSPRQVPEPSPADAWSELDDTQAWVVRSGMLHLYAVLLPAAALASWSLGIFRGAGDTIGMAVVCAGVLALVGLLIARDAAVRRRLGAVSDRVAVLMSSQQLADKQRMEALGRMAVGVAQDFSNVMTVIRSGAELALSRPDVGDDVRADLEPVLAAAENAGTLTARLLAFGQRQRLHRERIDLNALVREARPVLKRLVPDDCRLELELDDALPAVSGDWRELTHAVVNLVINAGEAMPDGGTITIRTAVVREHVDRSRGSAERVVLDVSDTGEGIPADLLARVFEPFHTSRPGGAGLGLSIVHGIVLQSGGRITVTSHPGTGTTFRISLPTTEIDAPPSRRAEAPTVSRPRKCVLLVEDDRVVRSITRRLLLDLSYDVIDAGSVDQARAIADEGIDGIDILISDVRLTPSSGLDLVEELRARREGLPAVLISGDPSHAADASRANAVFLAKPFARDALGVAIRQATGAGAGEPSEN